MKEELQKLADEHGEVSPLSQVPVQKRQRRLLRLQTSVGNVVVETWYGWDRIPFPAGVGQGVTNPQTPGASNFSDQEQPDKSWEVLRRDLPKHNWLVSH